MQKVCGLAAPPIFNPIVSDCYSGMVVVVPLFLKTLKKAINASQLRHLYEKRYEASPIVTVEPFGAESEYFSASALTETDRMQILVTGNDEALNLIARFDNLGKGASGAAMQCMNLMLGIDETKGLVC
jgi:N-acetyl-gamma-glutamyl-phosphate reductase